jgi:hypothetical protein
MKEDLLQRAKARARRLTKREIMDGNMDMFRQLGLDEGDVERMANEVGLEVDDLLLLHPSHVVACQPAPAAPGRPGRKSETYDIAVFANERHPAMTWDEVFREWIRRFPADKRVRNKEFIRGAHRRFFGDKAKARKSREKKPRKSPCFFD